VKLSRNNIIFLYNIVYNYDHKSLLSFSSFKMLISPFNYLTKRIRLISFLSIAFLISIVLSTSLSSNYSLSNSLKCKTVFSCKNSSVFLLCSDNYAHVISKSTDVVNPLLKLSKNEHQKSTFH